MSEYLIELGRCKPGQILRAGYRRAGYRRSDGTRVGPARVAPSCVPDKGAPGKTPASRRVLPEPEKGALGRWKKDMAASERRRSLKTVVERRGCRAVIGSLTLLRNLTADPGTKRAAKADAKWLHDQNFCRLKSKSR